MAAFWGERGMASRAFLALAAAAATAIGASAQAQTFIEHSAEFRMQIDFAVPDAALRKFLPAGWEPAIAPQGPAKDCNLRVIFIDRADITGADGAPTGTNRLVYLAAPVKQTGTSNVGQIIIAGLSADAKEVPGAFGNYELATKHSMQRTLNDDGKTTIGEETWSFAAASGEQLDLHIKYERAPARKNTQEVKFFQPGNPASYQIFKVDSGLDIMRNASVPVKDRVSEFSYKISGGRLAAMFDGTEKVLSLDSFHWYSRGIYQP
jgi:hypothetical protein